MTIGTVKSQYSCEGSRKNAGSSRELVTGLARTLDRTTLLANRRSKKQELFGAGCSR